MVEINLLKNYPESKRPIEERAKTVTEADRAVAKKFGREYFDGTRNQGYGGYYYHPRFWEPVVPTFQKYYGLTAKSSILDVGCGKGFMIYDFQRLIPGITVAGLDISQYAIDNAKEEVKPFVRVGNAKDLPYENNSFDLVICINTVHNLPLEECKQAIKEIQRVTRKDAFITVDAWRTKEEKERMQKWNLTAETYMHVDDWKKLFVEVGYKGDYYWFIAE